MNASRDGITAHKRADFDRIHLPIEMQIRDLGLSFG